jgi:hypothetical protein
VAPPFIVPVSSQLPALVFSEAAWHGLVSHLQEVAKRMGEVGDESLDSSPVSLSGLAKFDATSWTGTFEC